MQTFSATGSRPFTAAAARPGGRVRLAPIDATSVQFVKGVDETVVPEVSLTRSRDGSNGTAKFVFKNPTVFEASSELGEITGLYLADEEGTISTVDVNAKFINGKPDSIECRYVMRSTVEWDRFMRFMERYAEDKGLSFRGK